MKKLIPAALILLSAVPMLAGLARLLGLATNLIQLDGHARFAADPLPAVLHIVGATSFATLGALQFAPSLRRGRWHRVAGWILAPGAVVAAASGIWMVLTWPPKPFDSTALNTLRIAAAVALIGCMAIAIITAMQRNFVAHGRWMLRAYALGAAAGTQFFTLLPLLIADSLHTPSSEAALMGLAWVINLVVVEWHLAGRAMPPVLEVTRPSR